MDMNSSLSAALQLEKLALFVIVTIIVLGAAFAIIGHLVLLVAEKRKEIGVLKAIGASGRSITMVFFTVGMTIGVAGTLAGSVLGLGLIWAQNTYKIIRLASHLHQIHHPPLKLTPPARPMGRVIRRGRSPPVALLPGGEPRGRPGPPGGRVAGAGPRRGKKHEKNQRGGGGLLKNQPPAEEAPPGGGVVGEFLGRVVVVVAVARQPDDL